MKYDTVYEVVDHRQLDPGRRIGPVGIVQTLPGGLQVIGITGPGLVVDDSIGFDDDPETGIVELMTAEGRVTLVELTVERYHATIEPVLRGLVPDFSTDAEMIRGLARIIRED